MATDELTVEVWVKPANVEQQGPARIVTVSDGPGGGDRNFSLNQGRFGEPADQRAKWTARASPNSGIGDFSTPNGTATTELQHVVFTHNANTGAARIYVDGEVVGSLEAVGNYDDWELDRDLALVNEAGLVGSGRSWVGELHLVAVYSRALATEEVLRNFEAGSGTTPPGGSPLVTITNPASGENFTAPAQIIVEADASDPDGSVQQVEFFANGTGIGTATTSPYRVDWMDVPLGVYLLTATATDDQGNSTTSDPVEISVQPDLATSYSNSVLADNPVAYWRFEETAGSTVAEETGTHDAAITNGPELDVNGIQGSAIQFIGANQTYAETPPHPALDITGSITIEFWLNIGDAWSVQWEAIIGKGDDTYQIRRSGATSNLRFDVRGVKAGISMLLPAFSFPPMSGSMWSPATIATLKK